MEFIRFARTHGIAAAIRCNLRGISHDWQSFRRNDISLSNLFRGR